MGEDEIAELEELKSEIEAMTDNNDLKQKILKRISELENTIDVFGIASAILAMDKVHPAQALERVNRAMQVGMKELPVSPEAVDKHYAASIRRVAILKGKEF